MLKHRFPCVIAATSLTNQYNEDRRLFAVAGSFIQPIDRPQQAICQRHLWFPSQNVFSTIARSNPTLVTLRLTGIEFHNNGLIVPFADHVCNSNGKLPDGGSALGSELDHAHVHSAILDQEQGTDDVVDGDEIAILFS